MVPQASNMTQSIPQDPVQQTDASAKSQDLSELAAQLQKHHDGKHIELLIRRSYDLKVNSEVFQLIQQWLQQPLSKTLWICGPSQVPKPSRNTIISASIIEKARKAKAPIIAYFYVRSNKANTEDPKMILVEMAYSLISQLLNTMQHIFVDDSGLVAIRLSKMDGSLSSLLEALVLLKDLLSMGPELLFCIVDGLENFGHLVRDDPSLRRLLDILQPSSKKQSTSSNKMKTLFTTDGFTDALIHLPVEERLDVSNFSAMPEYMQMAFLRF